MFVMDQFDKVNCNSIEEVDKIIKRRNENGENTIYMRPRQKEPWPLMSILVRDDKAFIQVCVRDFHRGYISLTNYTLDLDYADKTIFHEGERSVDVQNIYVISINEVFEAVHEFYQTEKLPECIEWS